MIEIPQELTDPETVEMDFGDTIDFMTANGTYLDIVYLGIRNFGVIWIVNDVVFVGSGENIFKAVANVMEKVRDDYKTNE